MKLNTLLLSISCAALTLPLFAQNTRMETFCNPLNVDYTYMIFTIRIRIFHIVREPILPLWNFVVSIICLSLVHMATGILQICKTGILFRLLPTGIRRDVTLLLHIIIKIHCYMYAAIPLGQ